MARGTIAKQNVINVIANAFGKDYIGEVDKKIYVWANDGGERVQIALTLTCPKVNVDVEAAVAPSVNADHDWDFGSSEPAAAKPLVSTKSFQPAEITQDERDTVAELMARLGL